MYIKAALTASLLLYSGIVLSNGKSWGGEFEQGEWQFSGNAIECQLSQKIDGFGKVSIISEAGLPLFVSVESNHLDPDVALQPIMATPAYWDDFQPYPVEGLGAVSVSPISAEVVVGQAYPIFEQLHNGRWIEMVFEQSGHSMSAVLSNVRFRSSAEQFLACRSSLLPMNFYRVKDNTFYLSPVSPQLSEHDIRSLHAIAEYVKAHQGVKTVLVDGYMDFGRRNSIQLRQSHEMADEVASVLLEMGVDFNKIKTRAHGGRYPQGESQPAGKGRVRVRVIKASGAMS